jgi:hypothetical protein
MKVAETFLLCSGDFVGVRMFAGLKPTRKMHHQVCGMILVHCCSIQR